MEPSKPSHAPVFAIPHEEVSPTTPAIREQLDRILDSSFFRKSKRYSAFLRYSVERVLAGQSEYLKERIVGIEVFGRPADYNTAVDHVVRSAASEIRKRLAQYYADPATAGEVRIDLLPGSYVPHFSSVRHQPFEVEKSPVPTAQSPTRRNTILRWTIGGAAISLSVVITLLISSNTARHPILNIFWDPILSSREPVTLCVGSPSDRNNLSDSAARQVAGVPLARSNRVSFASATTLAKLTGLLQSRGKQYQMMLQSATKFSDLQRGPSVLIGGFNNGWTMRLSSTLRFGFERQAGHLPRIRDGHNPSRSDWSVNFARRDRQITHDYAIVSRLQDPNTEQITVIVAGIAHWGTLAAGEFITDFGEMEKLRALAPKHWEHMNMQIVLSTDVIDGVSGPPKIVATHFW